MKQAEATIRMLRDGVTAKSRPEWRRIHARTAWVLESVDRLREAQREMHERCCEAVEHLGEEAFELFCDIEQARVDTIRAEIDAVIERDAWPRHLYWRRI